MGLFWPRQKQARPSWLEVIHKLVKGFIEAVVGCKQAVQASCSQYAVIFLKGSQVGIRAHLSLNNIVEQWVCFLAPAEGHLPLPLLCLFTSALAHGHSLACLGQRRGLPLCLVKYIAQAKGGPRQEQGRAQGSVTNSTKPLPNRHFGNVTPSLALPEYSKGCRAVSAVQGVISRHTLNCYVGH